jgi:hydrogenase expression/formation protein HypC
LLDIHQQGDLPMGKVEFGGIVKDVCLAYTPEAHVGDYVLVHVGFAISRIEEAEAQEIFSYLEEIAGTMEERAADGERGTGEPSISKSPNLQIQNPSSPAPRPSPP